MVTGVALLSFSDQWFIYLSLSMYFHCWSRKWLLIPVFVPGKFYGQRSLAGYSPWDCNRVRHNFREGNGTHSRTLAWKIPWTEEPGGLQSVGSRRVGHDWATSLSLFTFMHWRRKWHPLQCSCLENPRDGGAWWAAVYGVAQSRTRLKRLSSSRHTLVTKPPPPCIFCHEMAVLNTGLNLLTLPIESRRVKVFWINWVRFFHAIPRPPELRRVPRTECGLSALFLSVLPR